MAEDTRVGTTQPTVVHINRDRAGAPAAPAADWRSGGVVPEGTAGTPWGGIIGGIATLAWLGACGVWAVGGLGPDRLLALPPVEAAALAAAAFLPVTIIWLIVALLDRGAALRREAAALRRQLALLAYPAEAAQDRISTIGDSLRAQVRDLSAATREAATQGESLRLLLSRETRELARLTEQIDGDTRHALGRVAGEVQGLSALMERVAGLAGDMDQTLARRQEALDGAAGRAERSAEALGRSLAGQSRALGEAADALDQRCATIDSLVSRQEEGLSKGREVASAFEQAARALSDSARDATTGLARRAESLEEANRVLTERAVSLAAALREAEDASVTLGGDLDQRARTLAERSRDIRETAHAAAQELDAATAAALGDFNTFRDVAHETVAGAQAAAAAVRDAATQGETVQHLLHDQARALEEAVRTLGAEVRSSGETVRAQTADIEQVTEKAGERIRHLADLVSRNAVDITRTTARSVVEIETVSEGLKAAIGEVSLCAGTLREAAEDLGNESAAAYDRLRDVTAAMHSGRAAVSEAAEAFAADTDRVAEAANAALDALARVGHDLREEADGLAAAADGAIGRGRLLHETLANIVEAWETSVGRSTDRLDKAGERLRIAAETYESTAVHASDRLTAASDDLDGRARAIERVSAQASAAMDALAKNMDTKTGVLQMAGDKVADNLRKAAAEFARHTEAVVTATRAAADQARALEAARDKVELHRFLKQTSYAVERLQAAAVDITRLFTPSVEDDLWKRFYKGEHNAFLRQAARSITRSQAAAVRKLFAQNAEFRDYASRYMGEYEALMKAARQNDRADVLTAVFTASDMGRLYTVLAKSTGRGAIA